MCRCSDQSNTLRPSSLSNACVPDRPSSYSRTARTPSVPTPSWSYALLVPLLDIHLHTDHAAPRVLSLPGRVPCLPVTDPTTTAMLSSLPFMWRDSLDSEIGAFRRFGPINRFKITRLNLLFVRRAKNWYSCIMTEFQRQARKRTLTALRLSTRKKHAGASRTKQRLGTPSHVASYDMSHYRDTAGPQQASDTRRRSLEKAWQEVEMTQTACAVFLA